MRECAMNGEFDNSLQSDMQDLTKKIKEGQDKADRLEEAYNQQVSKMNDYNAELKHLRTKINMFSVSCTC